MNDENKKIYNEFVNEEMRKLRIHTERTMQRILNKAIQLEFQK